MAPVKSTNGAAEMFEFWIGEDLLWDRSILPGQVNEFLIEWAFREELQRRSEISVEISNNDQ